MKYKILKDIIEWDIKNWSKLLKISKKYIRSDMQLNALALGERNGGLSLWLALNDINVICSDLKEVKNKAVKLHLKYQVENKIKYDNVDILNIKYPDDTFDYIIFKSVLGGLRKIENQFKAFSEIHRVLKKGGQLIFAENLAGSKIHKILRKRFVTWSSYWRYPSLDEIKNMIQIFSQNEYKAYGFFGSFGRREWQRYIFGLIDIIFDNFISSKLKYIFFCVSTK